MNTNNVNDFVADDLIREVQEFEQYFKSLGLLESINRVFECPNTKKLISEIFGDLKLSIESLMPERVDSKQENGWEQFYYNFNKEVFVENIKMNYKLKVGHTLKEALALVHDQSLKVQIVKSIKLQFDNSEEDEAIQLEIASIAELIKTVIVQTLIRCIKNVSVQQTVYEDCFDGNIGFFEKKEPKYLS